MERDLNYENTNIAYDCQYSEENGGGIKCKNYELCEAVLPKWWFECKSNYLCTNCHMKFGTWGNSSTGKGVLEIRNNIDCPICFECKKCISQPRCDHFVCIDCFKKCHYPDTTGEPVFPYPEIEDRYFEDTENPLSVSDYPLINLYNEEYNNWDDNRWNRYSNQQNLRRCPLCRS